MIALHQILAVTAIGFRTLPSRRTGMVLISATMIVLIVGTFYFFSLLEGVTNAVSASADPMRVVVLSQGRPLEGASKIYPADVERIRRMRGIARNADGTPMADAQISGSTYGLAPDGFALRPELKLVEGRMFQPGRLEVIAGVRTHAAFGYRLGSKVKAQNAEWTVVGFFSAGNLLDVG